MVSGWVNVGLVCHERTRVAVMDPDNLDLWADLVDELGQPSLPWTLTGSGKLHYYVQWESDLPAKILWGEKVGELQRGPGQQQVVLPGSVHPSGGPYRWITERSASSASRSIPSAIRCRYSRTRGSPTCDARPMSSPVDPVEVERRRTAALQQPGAVVRSSGLIKFQCPRCREEGHDRIRITLVVFEDGALGCAVVATTGPRSAGARRGASERVRARRPRPGSRPLGGRGPGVGDLVLVFAVGEGQGDPRQRRSWRWEEPVDLRPRRARLSRRGLARPRAGSRKSAIILSAEDGVGDTIRPRVEAMGGDVDQIYVLDAVRTGETDRMFDLSLDLPVLEDALHRVGDVWLVSIDPVSAYLGKTDSHRDAALRGVLAPLARLAERYGVAVLAAAHLNKHMGSKDGAPKALYRTGGTIALPAAARIALIVGEKPDDPGCRGAGAPEE